MCARVSSSRDLGAYNDEEDEVSIHHVKLDGGLAGNTLELAKLYSGVSQAVDLDVT